MVDEPKVFQALSITDASGGEFHYDRACSFTLREFADGRVNVKVFDGPDGTGNLLGLFPQPSAIVLHRV